MITHNFMGFGYGRLNYFDLAKSLDFVSWDNYPVAFWHPNQATSVGEALNHAAMRGLKRQAFWVMEEQAGPSGWWTISSAPRPGQLRRWAYQAIAHGADGVSFFRWRTARYGAEQYWHGILDHAGLPNRRYEEVKQMGLELKTMGESLRGSKVKARVALIQSYDSRFAFQVQPNCEGFSYEGHLAQIYTALWKKQVGVDILSPTDALEGYDLVIAPALHVVTEGIKANLEAFVNHGGTLVITPRTGVKDEHNAIVNLPLPGLLAELCGGQVEEYDAIGNQIEQTVIFEPGEEGDLAGKPFKAALWCDVLATDEAEVLAHYGKDYYAGKPAILNHKVSQGQVLTLGTFGSAELYDAFFAWLLQEKGIGSILEVPEGVEVTERFQEGKRLIFVLNDTGQKKLIFLKQAYFELIHQTEAAGKCVLEPYDVMILKEQVS